MYAVVPTSTIDLKLASGDEIPIEFRGKDEVVSIEGNVIAPTDSEVYNPAFDVTPHEFITAIITEKGICYPPFNESLRDILLHCRDCSTNIIQCAHNTSTNNLHNIMIAPNELKRLQATISVFTKSSSLC